LQELTRAVVRQWGVLPCSVLDVCGHDACARRSIA
jgi:hypothetical protein